MAAKVKNVKLTEAFIEAFSGVFRTQSNNLRWSLLKELTALNC